MVIRKEKGKITNVGMQNHIKFKLWYLEIGLKFYWTWTCPSEQDPVSPSDGFSHEEASINLLCLSIRGQKEQKPQPQKINQTDHMDHSCV